MKMQIVAVALVATAGVANADLIAYWNQNNNANALAADGFAYTPSSFPMAADAGAGSWGIENFDGTVDGDGLYTKLDSFSGTTVGALFGDDAGGSFSFIGDSNNGAMAVLSFDATNYESITLDFARRGTGTGYNFVDIAWRDSVGTLHSVGTINAAGTSTWVAFNFDFGSALDGDSSAEIVITFDGASSTSGNNRLDNVTISGTLVPAPGTAALIGLGGLVATRRRR